MASEHDNVSAPSAKIVLDEIKGMLATQNARITALDGKANFGLASASLLTAGAINLKSTFFDAQQAERVTSWQIGSVVIEPQGLVGAFTVVVTLIYIWVVFSAYQGYK